MIITRCPELSSENEYTGSTDLDNVYQKELYDCYLRTERYIQGLAAFLSSVCGASMEDLCQEGFIGVVKARERFDPSRASFFTYAQYWIKVVMYTYAYRHSAAVRLPDEFYSIYSRYSRMVSEQDLQHHPDKDKIIAESMGISKRRLRRALSSIRNARCPQDISWVAEIVEADDMGTNEVELFDAEVMRKVKEIVTPEEFFVIKHTIGLEGNKQKTLNWVGKIVGLTKERVRQIRNKGLQKIKNEMYVRLVENKYELVELLPNKQEKEIPGESTDNKASKKVQVKTRKKEPVKILVSAGTGRQVKGGADEKSA